MPRIEFIFPPVTVNGPEGLGGSSSWGDIDGTLSSQSDLQAALDAKAATGHGHVISDVTGLQTALNGKSNSPITDVDIPAGIARDSEVTSAIAAHAAAADPHSEYERESQRGAVNGYASLDGGTLVPNAQLGSGVADGTTFLRGDRTWSAPSGGAATAMGYQEYQHVSGGSGIACYYVAGVASGSALVTGAPTANVLRAFPFTAPARGGTLDQLAFNVTTLLAGNARIGLYANTSAGNLYPGALIAGSGDISTATAGVKTLATTQVLTAGAVYWLAIVGSSAATLRCLALASMPAFLGLPTAFGTAWQVGVSRAFTYAALPASFGSGGAGITAVPVPALAYRLSA